MNTIANTEEIRPALNDARSPSSTPRLPASTMSRRGRAAGRREATAGMQAMLPWLVGVVPFGMVVGMTARTSGVPLGAGLLSGATIYSGSAQLTAIGLLADGAGPAVVVASVLIINARLILYSSSIGRHWRGSGPGFRAGAAYLLVDPSYVVGMRRYEGDGGRVGNPHVHYVAAGVTLWVAWHAAMLAGAVIGAGLPEWLPLEHAVSLFLLAEAVQAVRTKPSLMAAAAASAVAVVGANLPLHSGLLVAVAAGVGGALAVERRMP